MCVQAAGKSWSFMRIVRYTLGTTGAGWLGWKFVVEAQGDVHRFEYSLIRSLQQLPLYPPPFRAEMEDQIRTVSGQLPAEIGSKFVEWFLETDRKSAKHGVLRQDVLDFMEERTALRVDVEVRNQFLNKGRGRGEEEQRLSEVSLLGALVFLRDVINSGGDQKVQESIRKLYGDLDSIENEVLQKERLMLERRENLSEAEQTRLDQLVKETSH